MWSQRVRHDWATNILQYFRQRIICCSNSNISWICVFQAIILNLVQTHTHTHTHTHPHTHTHNLSSILIIDWVFIVFIDKDPIFVQLSKHCFLWVLGQPASELSSRPLKILDSWNLCVRLIESDSLGALALQGILMLVKIWVAHLVKYSFSS